MPVSEQRRPWPVVAKARMSAAVVLGFPEHEMGVGGRRVTSRSRQRAVQVSTLYAEGDTPAC